MRINPKFKNNAPRDADPRLFTRSDEDYFSLFFITAFPHQDFHSCFDSIGRPHRTSITARAWGSVDPAHNAVLRQPR